MGKRRKRLTMAKYATKYASVREHVMPQGGVKNTEEVVREPAPPVVEEAAPEPTPVLDAAVEELQAPPEVVEEVVEAPTPVEEPEPVKAAVVPKKKRASTPRKRTTRKKATAKTTRSSD